MEDNSFLKFTDDNIIEKIDIDERLIASFKRVMKKIQNYFNANGYTKERNYQEFLEKYLLNSGLKNMRFYINKLEPKAKHGFYRRNDNGICINEHVLDKSNDCLDATLCHEFIHFLVMHGLDKDKSNPDIYYGGFFNEALTEMLTEQMYPNSNAYDAQVAMMKFANIISENNNNFSQFLQGQIDARYSSPNWENFRKYAFNFQQDFYQMGYITLAKAKNNENFVKAQRYLIDLFINPYSKKSIDEYVESISKLLNRPVNDKEYISNIISKLDNTLIKSLNIKNNGIEQFLYHKLNELKKQIIIKNQCQENPVYEFEFDNRKLALDKNYNLLGNTVGLVMQLNYNKGLITLRSNNNKLILDIKNIDFNEKENKISKNIKELSSYFNSEVIKDLKTISKAKQNELVKLEKFVIPILEDRQKLKTIYVATYSNNISILNGLSKIKMVKNIDLNKYIGMSSTNPLKALIYYDKLGVIKEGIMFSLLNREQIKEKAINIYSNQLEKLLTDDQINKAIWDYKNSEYFYDDTKENIKREALNILADKFFKVLNESDKNNLLNMVKENNPKFVIYTDYGQTNIAYINNQQVAYQGSKEVLYDLYSKGKYNEIFEQIDKEITNNVNYILPIDSAGNIIDETEVINDEFTESFNQKYNSNLESDKEKLLKQNYNIDNLNSILKEILYDQKKDNYFVEQTSKRIK